jgi:tetratricopeptide (TPR) repeat protein
MPKVFISATSRDLKSYRAVVADWARTHSYEPVVQDEFPVQSDYATIVQMLREKLDPCDAVIHLAGMFYGFEPSNRLDGEARRSYTQLEFELGKELRRQVFRFIARPDYQPDHAITQASEHAELQQQHRQRLMQGDEALSPSSRTTGNELYYEFSSHDELRSLLNSIHIKPTLAKPHNLPLVGSLFKGREEFIDQLRSVLVSKPTHIAAVTAKQAIHGLGGIGKTRVAVEYGLRFSHEYTALLFITADSPTNLERHLANLCGALVLNLPERDAREQEVQVAAALRWLREHSGWFLIIDNVDTPEAAQAVESLLQQLDTGHVVVTSRLSQWGGAVEELALDVLGLESARAFLLERTQGRRKPIATDEADAEALATDLGQLPLALEQAGAFIAKHRGSLQEYRARWKKQEAKVIQWHDLRSMQYPASIATTWQTSFELVGENGRGLLNVICWLSPDPIPLTIIEKLSADGDEVPIDVETGLADLADYSLIKWTNEDHDFIQVHRLVEEITRYRLPEVSRTGWLFRAIRMVTDFVAGQPDGSDIHTWPTIYDIGRSHFAAIIGQAEGHQLAKLTTYLMTHFALYLQTRSELAEAERLFRRALAVNEQSFGSDHRKIAFNLYNLAGLLKHTSRLAEAETLFHRALAISEQSFGADHQFVASALNGLASVLVSTNRLAEAELLIRRALAIDEQAFGVTHRKVTASLNNLAHNLNRMNRLAEAELLYRRAITIFEQSSDPDHPDVANILSNLVELLTAMNRLAEAEPLIRRSLSIFEQSFGPEHPQFAKTLNRLALLLQRANRLEEAEPVFLRALIIFEQCFDPEHFDVANTLNNLAGLFYATNRLAEAEPLFRRALTVFEQCFGPEHPDVATALTNLALLLQKTNRLEEAEPLLRRALSIDERSLGPEHPNVASILHSLAMLLQETNHLTEAEPLLRRALSIGELSSGSEHPDVAITLNNLAMLLQKTNRLTEAEPLMRRALSIDERRYGPEHPNFAVTLSNLGEVLRLLGRFEEAGPHLRRALEIGYASLEPNHLDVAIIEYKLAMLEYRTGNDSEARRLLSQSLQVLRANFGDDSHSRIQEALRRMREIGMDPPD